jgi:hypothetical protein
MANSFDSAGNQHFTRYGEWEVACRKRGLQGPVDSDSGKHFLNSFGEVKGTWNSVGGTSTGVLLK